LATNVCIGVFQSDFVVFDTKMVENPSFCLLNADPLGLGRSPESPTSPAKQKSLLRLFIGR
jgi:hypothetical protein